jgi:tetratricopeptide (TPR) repeat protein
LKKVEAGWCKHVRAAYRDRDYARVIETGARILEFRPKLAETAVLVGRAHYALEQWDEALERLSDAIDSGAEGPIPWLFRARSAMKASAFEAAFESYETVQHLAGDDEPRMRSEAATHRLRLPERSAREALRLVRCGELDRAWALAGFALKHRPDDPLVQKVRAEVVRSLTTKFRSDLRKRPDDAIDTGWLLLERDPDNLVALRVLPRLLMRERRFGEAFELLKRLKRLNPAEPSLELQFARCERWKRALNRQPRTTAGSPRWAAN